MPGSKPADDLVLRLVRLAFCVAALAAVRPAWSAPWLLSRAEFGDIREICSEIERAAGAKPFHLAALGKSPSPFLAFFRARSRSSARQLPLTKFQYGEDGIAPLDEALVPRLFEHFDRYLPTDEAMAGKALLVVDFTATGASARAFDRYFRRYLEERDRTLNYRFVALHLGTPPRLPRDAFPVAAAKPWLHRAFYASKFDDFAPRGDFDVRRHPRPLPGSGRFEDLVEAIAAHLARDRWAVTMTRPNVRRVAVVEEPCSVLIADR